MLPKYGNLYNPSPQSQLPGYNLQSCIDLAITHWSAFATTHMPITLFCNHPHANHPLLQPSTCQLTMSKFASHRNLLTKKACHTSKGAAVFTCQAVPAPHKKAFVCMQRSLTTAEVPCTAQQFPVDRRSATVWGASRDAVPAVMNLCLSALKAGSTTSAILSSTEETPLRWPSINQGDCTHMHSQLVPDTNRLSCTAAIPLPLMI